MHFVGRDARDAVADFHHVPNLRLSAIRRKFETACRSDDHFINVNTHFFKKTRFGFRVRVSSYQLRFEF